MRIKQDGSQTVKHHSQKLDLPNDLTEQDIAGIELPETLSEEIAGEVTVALRSSELLMRTMRFPTANPQEVADMVGFQVDKISPFPLDQLAVAHEILSLSEDSAYVLMAAAKRNRIDAIGDAFESKGVRIHSIDARVLGWLRLLHDAEQIEGDGCELIIIIDGIDFVLAVLQNGKPLVLRSLEARLDDMTVIEELNREISYTLTMLDAEIELPPPNDLHIWSNVEIPSVLGGKLAEKCGFSVAHHDLNELPPLSEGLLRRTRSKQGRIELIPTEWVEHQKKLKLRKQFMIVSGGITAAWLATMLVFMIVFQVRTMKWKAAKADAAAIAPSAQQAAINQQKLRRLQAASDRSDSSLECLLEVTRLLPAGDIEFLSYNYKKGDAVTVRGTARDNNIVIDFFKTLADSKLLRLTDQSQRRITKGGIQRSEFNAKLELPDKEETP